MGSRSAALSFFNHIREPAAAMAAKTRLTNSVQRHDAYDVNRPAEEKPDRASRSGDAPVDTECLPPLDRIGEGRREQGQYRRGEQRPECALDGPGRNQHGEVERGTTERRRQRKADQSDEERTFSPDDVADASAQEQEAAEREGVARHHPLAVGVGEVEVVLRGGERNVDDRVVEDDHQLGHAQDGENPPPTGVIRVAVG